MTVLAPPTIAPEPAAARPDGRDLDAPLRGARTPPTGPRRELRALTGLRMVAAGWVVIFHFHFTPLPGIAEVTSVLGPLVTSGALGVDLFFVLSGFVIAHTYLDQLGPALRLGGTARFLWARACRMWPAYVVVLHLFGLWLLARIALDRDGMIAYQAVQPVVDGGEWLRQLVMVQVWDDQFLDGASWVGPTWSISAEWLVYLLFPVTALGFFRMRRLPVWLLAVAAFGLMAPIAWAYLSVGHPYQPWSWLTRISCGFAAGVLAHLVVARLRPTKRVRGAASVAAAVVPTLIVGGLLAGELIGPGRGGVVIVAFPLLVGALALADRGPARMLARPFAVAGGRLSYSLYLVHIPIFELYWLAQAYLPELRASTTVANVVAGVVVLVTLPVAAVLYGFVEEPAQRRMRRLAEPRRAAVVAGRHRLVTPEEAVAGPVAVLDPEQCPATSSERHRDQAVPEPRRATPAVGGTPRGAGAAARS